MLGICVPKEGLRQLRANGIRGTDKEHAGLEGHRETSGFIRKIEYMIFRMFRKQKICFMQPNGLLLAQRSTLSWWTDEAAKVYIWLHVYLDCVMKVSSTAL